MEGDDEMASVGLISYDTTVEGLSVGPACERLRSKGSAGAVRRKSARRPYPRRHCGRA